MSASSKVNQWLIETGARCETPADLLEGFCLRLRDQGVPVDRATLGAPLLHPIAQSSYVFWNIESGASQRWFQWTPEGLETMQKSPIHPIYEHGQSNRLFLSDADDRNRFPIGIDLWHEGYVEYDALPLPFTDGSFKALTVATRTPDGFTGEQRDHIVATLPVLALVFEGFMARNTAQTLMETYVGKRAGLRVLDGEIARGDGSRIDAVIWFSDLRDFTGLAGRNDEEALLAILNDYFELVTDAVEAHGGEVLKFIGDAMLAIFPDQGDLSAAVANAENAALRSLADFTDRGEQRYAFGIGLHPGHVFYGNIGGGTRLDFTVIGNAVNIASRIEDVAGKQNRALLVSEDLVRNSKRRWAEIGRFDLKGVEKPTTLYAPA